MANTKSIDFELSSAQTASITHALQTGLALVSDFTIELWVKLESQPATNGYMVLATKGGSDYGGGYMVRYTDFAGTTKLCLQISTAAVDTEKTIDYTLSSGTWYHITWVYDRTTNTAECFIGTEGTEPTSIGSVADFLTLTASTGAEFRIAKHSFANEGYYDGLIDEVRVWNDKRSSAELIANYKTELTGSEANLVGYWKFNDTATDETANNNDLTLVNSPVYSTDIPTWAPADLNINIYDSIAIAEDITKMLEINSSVYDSISIAENITPENTELGPVNIYDSISIAENISSSIDLGNISVYDSVTIAENITPENTELGPVSVYDSISIAENISNSIDLGGINVFDAITITESVSAVQILFISTYDSISISENINSLVPDLGGISVYDEITIAENVSSSGDLGGISVLETITISENINIATENNVSVYDSIAISENVSASIHLGNISVYDSITIAESVTTFVADPRTGFIGLSSRQQSYPLGFDIRIEDRPLKFRSKQQNYPLGMEDSRTL